MKIIQIAMWLLVFNLACFMLVQASAFPKGTAPPGLYTATEQNSTAIYYKMGNTTTVIDKPITSISVIATLAFGVWQGVDFFMKVVVNAPSTFAYLVGVMIPGFSPMVCPVTGIPVNDPIVCSISTAMLAIMWIIYLAAIIQLLTGRAFVE